MVYCLTKDGSYLSCIDDIDLFFAPEKHEDWINLYKGFTEEYRGGKIFTSEEEAKKSAREDCMSTIKIEWEELSQD